MFSFIKNSEITFFCNLICAIVASCFFVHQSLAISECLVKLFSFSPPPPRYHFSGLQTPFCPLQIDTYSSSAPPSRAHLVFMAPFSIPQPASCQLIIVLNIKSVEGCFQCLGMWTNPLLTPNSSNSYHPIFKLFSKVVKRSESQLLCFKTPNILNVHRVTQKLIVCSTVEFKSFVINARHLLPLNQRHFSS